MEGGVALIAALSASPRRHALVADQKRFSILSWGELHESCHLSGLLLVTRIGRHLPSNLR